MSVPTRNNLDPARLPMSLTPQQFMALSGLSRSTVYRWLGNGEIKSTRAGPKLLRIPRSELVRVLGWEI